jgi:STE24 endopeptidase
MPLDPHAAAAAYIDALGADALGKAAAYTVGSHWLVFWNLVVVGLVTWALVRSRVLDRLDARLAQRGPNLRALVVGVACLLLSSLLSLPWDFYASWWRERTYGHTDQSLADFLAQGLLSAVISALLGALFFVGVYALIRRTGRRWWIWSGALTAVALSAFLLASPIVIEPLFNDYKPVPEGEVRDALVALARQSGVSASRIYVYDGSRQSNNFTANVSGLGGSARIAISDVALKGASLDEVKAVTAHEVGHYVLGHIWRMVAVLSVLAMLAFFLADRLFRRVARAFGSGAALADPVGLPIVLFVVSLLAFLGQPLQNAMIRVGEIEADRFSLETVNLPDALASALVKTAEYRDPRPSELQELLFYSHPSVERRVLAAMEWKSAHRAQ